MDNISNKITKVFTDAMEVIRAGNHKHLDTIEQKFIKEEEKDAEYREREAYKDKCVKRYDTLLDLQTQEQLTQTYSDKFHILGGVQPIDMHEKLVNQFEYELSIKHGLI